jgi:hypothetical protein
MTLTFARASDSPDATWQLFEVFVSQTCDFGQVGLKTSFQSLITMNRNRDTYGTVRLAVDVMAVVDAAKGPAVPLKDLSEFPS